MFPFIVAVAMYLAFAPIRPAQSVQDYLPVVRIQEHLPMAGDRPSVIPARPFKKDAGRFGIETTAKAAVVLDWESGAVLFEKNAEEPLPIASITKLMTALVVLTEGVDLQSVMVMRGDDERPGGIAYLVPGERVSVDDLLHLSLIASSNGSTIALARSTGFSLDAFVEKMNNVAASLGMENTHFVDPSGLDPNNVASAKDVAVLVHHALSHEALRDVVSKKEFTLITRDGRRRLVRSTDELLDSFLNKPPYAFFGGKTGFLEEAGYCFGAAARNEDGNKIISVVLGAATKEARFDEVKALMYWTFDAFSWPPSP